MNDVHRDIEILKILHQGSMIVAGDFEYHLNLRQWHKGLDAVEKRAEALTGVVKRQGGTLFKTLMAGKQGQREEASDVCSLADIYPDVERFLRQEGKTSWRSWR
jgi:hypothetical protein